MLADPLQTCLLPTTSAGSFVTTSFPLPNVAAFVGVDLFFQAVAVDGSGLATSRGLRARIDR